MTSFASISMSYIRLSNFKIIVISSTLVWINLLFLETDIKLEKSFSESLYWNSYFYLIDSQCYHFELCIKVKPDLHSVSFGQSRDGIKDGYVLNMSILCDSNLYTVTTGQLLSSCIFSNLISNWDNSSAMLILQFVCWMTFFCFIFHS